KAMGLRSLGNALRVVGNLNKSRQALEQSLAVAQNLQSSSDISAALLSLGNTARAQQDTQTALAYYQQVAEVSTSPITRTQAQLNQLSLLLETQQLNSARTLGSQLQAQLANLPPSRATVYAQINFAKSLARLKQTGTTGTPSWEEIGQRLAAAIQHAKSLKDQRAEAYALGHLGELYEKTQQLGDAQNLTEQALLMAQSVNAPDIAYRWQWQLGRLQKAQGNMKGAIAAYSDAVKTLQSLRSDLVAINREIQFSFRDEVEPIYRQLVDLLLQPEGISGHTQENLIQARNVIESLQLAELDNFFRAACIEGQPVQIDQVVDEVDPTAAVLYPIILPDRLEVILKLPRQEKLLQYETPVAEEEVEKTLETLRRKLTLPYTLREVQSLSKQVYDWLIQPAEAELAKTQIDTLVFVLDGSLRNIPMAALYDGEQYLVEKYGVALTPGLQLLSPKSLERRELKALTAGLTESRLGFPALTNVAFELEEIQSEIPSTVLLNQEFTNTTLQKEIDSVSVPVVHLATHGQFSSNKEETFILTWDGRLDIEGLSNLLRQTDQNRTNAIELLVLSACQTATGDNRATLGLAGVAVRAGARSTLASLWSLDDESSAVLMSQFYRELAADTTRNKAEALRLAQLSLLHNPRYQHPRYWGPFVLVGNWL
ncbi:MAG: CHAT domain-containing protein, partial [Coleofasciculus sp. S288]|nr:CHAT domain-containing protein [Coleofasciculus sp. S288]